MKPKTETPTNTITEEAMQCNAVDTRKGPLKEEPCKNASYKRENQL